MRSQIQNELRERPYLKEYFSDVKEHGIDEEKNDVKRRIIILLKTGKQWERLLPKRHWWGNTTPLSN